MVPNGDGNTVNIGWSPTPLPSFTQDGSGNYEGLHMYVYIYRNPLLIMYSNNPSGDWNPGWGVRSKI